MSETSSFNFLRWLTGIVVLLYVGTAIFAFYRSQVTWQDFSGAVGPMSGLLLGYWVRGEK